MTSLPHSLDPIFHPRSIAVVGASASPGTVGSILIRNLIENPFGGVVYPVNPKRHAVHGVRCYADIASLPEVVDLAVIATPAGTVPGLIEDCVRRGIKSAIIISAGFSELGAAGRRLEDQIRGSARGNMRIIGPNCLGVIHPPREDEALIIALHASHSEHTIRMRFFSLVKTLSRDSLIRLCHLDYNREMALVAVQGEGEGEERK